MSKALLKALAHNQVPSGDMAATISALGSSSADLLIEPKPSRVRLHDSPYDRSQNRPARMRVPSVMRSTSWSPSKYPELAERLRAQVPFSATQAMNMSSPNEPRSVSLVEKPSTSPWKAMFCSKDPTITICPSSKATMSLMRSLLCPSPAANQPANDAAVSDENG